jgi:CRISPR-associated protein Cmr1
MKTLEASFRIVTPMFLGGSQPNDRAELREASFKGALRYWYRAIDPDYRTREAKIFGGSGKTEGQSMFLLRIVGKRQESTEWFDENRNGIKYFSFPFKMKQNRRYINCNSTFTLKLLFKKSIKDKDKDRKRILAPLWLLGHIGGVGSRSRRGFGTISLQSIIADERWEELDILPTPNVQKTYESWAGQFESGLKLLKSWFPGGRQDNHAVFGRQSRFRLVNVPKKSWRDSLDFIGSNMRNFRNRYDIEVPSSDYHLVRSHICAVKPNDATLVSNKPLPTKPVKLTTAPDRTAFGLPLTFRSNSLKYRITRSDGRSENKSPSVTFEGEDQTHGRSASRIHIRIIQIGNDYYPFLGRLDGPLLDHNEKIKDKHGSYDVPSDRLLDEYWNNLHDGMEVAWATI